MVSTNFVQCGVAREKNGIFRITTDEKNDKLHSGRGPEDKATVKKRLATSVAVVGLGKEAKIQVKGRES